MTIYTYIYIYIYTDISIDSKDFWSFSWWCLTWNQYFLRKLSASAEPTPSWWSRSIPSLHRDSYLSTPEKAGLPLAGAHVWLPLPFAPWTERPKCRWQRGSTSPGFKSLENSWDVLMNLLLWEIFGLVLVPITLATCHITHEYLNA